MATADLRRLADMPHPAARSHPRTICFPFSGDSIGGSHISTLGLLKRIDQRDFRILVVPEFPEGKVAGLFGDFGQPPDPVSKSRQFVPGEAWSLRKFLRATGGVARRARFLKRHGVDIVHINDGRTAASWALAARLAGTKLVWHHRGDPNALGLRLLAPAVAHRVLAVSTFALPRAGLWSAAGRAEVVYSPFDTDIAVDRAAAREALLREINATGDTVMLGYFGAIVPRKRPLAFVDALCRLQALVDRPVHGLIFGEARVPAMEQELRAHIDRRNANDYITLMGYRTPGAFWIGACDCLVVPAINEPFGRTLIEAMLVGTPVVASRSGGNIEAIDGGRGILVEPDNPEALAHACAQLAIDPAAAQGMADRAQADARQRFGEDEHARRVTAAYARL